MVILFLMPIYTNIGISGRAHTIANEFSPPEYNSYSASKKRRKSTVALPPLSLMYCVNILALFIYTSLQSMTVFGGRKSHL